jgi:hypothetical protein
MPDAPIPDWRDTGAEAPQPVGAKPWQTGAAPDGPSILPTKRSLKRTVALASLVLLACGIGAVIYWLRPIKPACLVLVGSGYETNLLLPSNVYGWNGLLAMDREVVDDEDVFKSLSRFSLTQPTKMRRVGNAPVEWKEKSWEETWKDIPISSERAVVVCLSLLGYADEKDAYLLPNFPGRQPRDFEKAPVPFRRILDSLKTVKNEKILLILDVCPAEVHWPIGMLHNDFVKRLQDKYGDEIKDNPKLTVICSCSPDQRSWGSEELQLSTFSHFLIEGLKGAGHSVNTNVTAQSLFDYVKENVDTWARTNRARKQTPILLPADSRAKSIDLVHVASAYEKTPLPPRPLNEEALKAEWARWKELKSGQAPFVHSPQVWRLYQDSLLRYEQLLRAGDPTRKADDLKKSLDKLHGDLTASRSLAGSYGSLGNSFPMFRLLGYAPPSDLRDAKLQEFLTELRTFDNAKPESLAEKKKLLERFREKSQMEKQYLRVRFNDLVLRDIQGPQNRRRETERLAEIDAELAAPQRPVETQLLKMLQEADDKLGAEAIRLALDVRVLAEEAALSASKATPDTELYSEAIFPWIQKDLKDADKLRREGEDLLFGDPVTHSTTATLKLAEARKQYEKVRDKSRELQRALAVRDEVSADFPYLAAWLAAVPASEQSKEKMLSLRLAAQEIGANLAKLNRALDAEDRKTLPSAKLVAQIEDDAKSIREELQGAAEKLKTMAKQQKNWHAIDAALHVPPASGSAKDVLLRADLLRKQREISTALLENPNPEGMTEKEEPRESLVKLQRELLRASLRPVVEIRQQEGESTDEKTRGFLLKLPKDIVAKTEDAEKETPDLLLAVNECRVIPGAFVEQIKDESGKRLNPVDRLRRLRLGDLFCRLAERTLEDHWFENGPQREERYYDSTGKAFLASARGLFEEGQAPEAFIKHLDAVKAKFLATKLQLGKLDRLHWTTESDLALKYKVQADDQLPVGSPMVWLEVTRGKNIEKAWPRKPLAAWPKSDGTFVLDRSIFSAEEDVAVNVHTVYRGQHLVETTQLERARPSVIVRHFPAPRESTFAVRMDSTFDYGAVSIVLDNSGSMKYRHPRKGPKDEVANKKAGERRRFDFALDALGHVLKTIPDNTEVSLYGLGVKDGTGFKTEPTQYRAPTRWRQKEEFESLLGSLDQIPGDIASPIAETMIKSMKEGFPKGFKGPKVLLVLTDGGDNASFKDDPVDRTARLVSELTRANEAHPEIVVVVVCFIDKTAEPDEFASAESQFKVVERFKIGGRFFDVSEGDKLGSIIEDLIRPRVQIALDDKIEAYPINYHHDRALNWKEVPPNDYSAFVPKTMSKQQVDLNLLPGQKLFMVLSREDEKLKLRLGVLARQPELERRGALRKEKEGWLVSLVENETKGLKSNVLKEIVVFEKKETSEDRVQQSHPGLVWMELDALNAAKPSSTLVWWKDWNVPAPGFRLEMRDWPNNAAPKLSTWFWPGDRDDLLSRKFSVRAAHTVPFREPLYGSAVEKPTVESVEWIEKAEVESPSGEKLKKKCLVVRVRHPEGRPVWVDLERRLPGVGSEHHYFAPAKSCTSYFYGLSNLDGGEINLVLTDVTAFKAAAQNVNFTPDVRIEAPRMFVPEVR